MLRKWTISLKEQKRNFRPSLSFSYPQIAFGLENKAKLNEMLCICSGLFVGLIVKAIYSLIIHCILYILVTSTCRCRAKDFVIWGGSRKHSFDDQEAPTFKETSQNKSDIKALRLNQGSRMPVIQLFHKNVYWVEHVKSSCGWWLVENMEII